MTIRIEVAYRSDLSDPRGREVFSHVRALLGLRLRGVRTADVYLIDADLKPSEVELVRLCLTDRVAQQSSVGRLGVDPGDYVVSVGYRAGVTDAVGKSVRSAIADLLGRGLQNEEAVYSSRTYFIDGADRDQAERIAGLVLANPVIERFQVLSRKEYLASPADLQVPRVRVTRTPRVQEVALSGSDDTLGGISEHRVLSLSISELRVIRAHFRQEQIQVRRRDLGLPASPTDVEIECLAQTWSEHCKHKIFNAKIVYEEAGAHPLVVNSVFQEHIRASTEHIRQRQSESQGKSWLVSVFEDNAGVIAFNDRWNLVFKVETHNSPSALDPYGGAMTGIVGVNRDTFGTGLGTDLLANTWGYCLADPNYGGSVPSGLMHPRRVRDGVHRGVIDGGNQSGVPYARGWECFDPRYLGKPLVFCGTVGRMPVRVQGRCGHRKVVRPGDRIVMCGGRIGKDGIHGATFSSMALDDSSPRQAVQIGDPITQRRLFDFLSEARDLGLYDAITDNGAGGLSSSVGELCRLSGGACMELSLAPLKYAGLDPWEILVSEAQERMTLAVSPERLEAFLALAERREVEATDLGEFTATGDFQVTWDGRMVASIPLSFLHDGVPQLDLRAVWQPTQRPEPVSADRDRFDDALLGILASINVASGERKARQYDHEVKGLSVVKPFVGARGDVPSDATVLLVEHGSWDGVVLSEGVNPFYSDIDTRWMTASVIDEAIRKAVGTGGRLDHMAGLDNYCWSDPIPGPDNPEAERKLGDLLRSTQALAEFCLAYGVPCVSGKDSMKNDSMLGGVRISIAPTLLFSVMARIDDVRLAVSVEAKRAGAWVYLLGTTRRELGGSEYYRFLGGVGNSVPNVWVQETIPLYRAVQQAIRKGLLQSCHSPGKGGLGVAVAKIAMGGELGLDVDLDANPSAAKLESSAALFSESNGRFVVTVDPRHAAEFEALMCGVACSRIGEVVEDGRVRIRHSGHERIGLEIGQMKGAWKGGLDV